MYIYFFSIFTVMPLPALKSFTKKLILIAFTLVSFMSMSRYYRYSAHNHVDTVVPENCMLPF